MSSQRTHVEKEITMRRFAVVFVVTAAAVFGVASTASADAPPPTNGGNGAGQSGQCTGNPDLRPPGDCH